MNVKHNNFIQEKNQEKSNDFINIEAKMPSFQSVEPQINNKNQDLKSAVTTIEKYDS